jgi:hypothetical protein
MSEARWTEATVAKLRYESQQDPGERGNYYRWEGGAGFGIRLGVNRQRGQLMAIRAELDELMAGCGQ